jgi:hypothetical protein
MLRVERQPTQNGDTTSGSITIVRTVMATQKVVEWDQNILTQAKRPQKSQSTDQDQRLPSHGMGHVRAASLERERQAGTLPWSEVHTH